MIAADDRDCVLVVGGGVIGAACAYYLRRAGRAVTLIEQGAFGGGCSHGNCGFICPSHVLPLAGPGAVRSTLRTLLARNSPLKVRWRLDPALWNWFWRFARRCNAHDMLSAGHALHSLLASSRSLYDELLATTLRDVEWEARGLLFVFQNSAAMDDYAATHRLLHEEFNVSATRYDGPALAELEPALKPGCAGGYHYEADGHLRPDKLMSAWRRVLEAEGVEIREHCELRDVAYQERLVRKVLTNQGEMAVDQVLIATGAWTPRLHRLLRYALPIQPGKGYSLTMPRPAVCPRLPMLFDEHRVAITPFASAYRIGSTMEFSGYDTRLPRARLRLLREGAAVYLREPVAEPVVEEWYGWRPMTPDGLPFIGAVPGSDNLFVAAGHGMLGVSMSPSTGRLAAELICGQTPHIDPAPFALDRRG